MGDRRCEGDVRMAVVTSTGREKADKIPPYQPVMARPHGMTHECGNCLINASDLFSHSLILNNRSFNQSVALLSRFTSIFFILRADPVASAAPVPIISYHRGEPWFPNHS